MNYDPRQLAIASEVETVVIVNGNYDNKRYKLDNAVVCNIFIIVC